MPVEVRDSSEGLGGTLCKAFQVGQGDWKPLVQLLDQHAAEDDGKFWFYNSMHFPEPMHHFDMITAEAAYVAMGAMNTRMHVLPTAKGVDHRIINGRVYIGGVVVTDPDEIAERVGEFQQRAFWYYENWETQYDHWKGKMRKLIADAETDQIAKLEKAGMQVTRPDLAPFRAKMDPAYKRIADYAGADNVKKFRDIVEKHRKG